MKKAIPLLVSLGILSACGGHTPNPVQTVRMGDSAKSCDDLEEEMSEVQTQMDTLLPDSNKTGKNVALGITGAIFIVPLFFMDFKNGERVEYEAYRKRYNHLGELAEKKQCGVEAKQYPTADELAAQAKAAQKK